MRQTPARPRPRPGRRARTLWEQGRRPGRQVVVLAVLGAGAAAWLDVLVSDRLSFFFDLVFLTVCIVAPLAVRPLDFFTVGVMPPLLMLGTVSLFAVLARSAVADEADGAAQAVVSGLAHHAGALVAGYALTLGVLALRQVARRNSGRLRKFA